MPVLQRFTINPDRVVHETIEGETVVIHLETGTYYSLRGSAAEIWGMLDHGGSSDQVAAEVARRFDKPVDAVAGPVKEFMRALVREELIERCHDGSSEPHPAAPTNGSPPAANPPAQNAAAPNPPGAEFVAPEFEKYTDMQYFLLLDPVHEVEASGWPHSDGSLSD